MEAQGGPKGSQGGPRRSKGSPRAAQGGSRGVQGATLEASENGPKNGGGCECADGTFLGPFWEVRRLRGTRRRGKGRINLPWIWVLEQE